MQRGEKFKRSFGWKVFLSWFKRRRLRKDEETKRSEIRGKKEKRGDSQWLIMDNHQSRLSVAMALLLESVPS